MEQFRKLYEVLCVYYDPNHPDPNDLRTINEVENKLNIPEKDRLVEEWEIKPSDDE
jgi:hypothetical protein